MARFSDLTEDLVAKILAFLPGDLLMQYKCVQKSWYSIIAEPRFVVKQLGNQILYNKNTRVLLKSKVLADTRVEENKFSMSFLSFGEDHVSSVVGKNVKIPSYTKGITHQLLGHCHGILCLFLTPVTVALANPATREFRQLHETSIHLSHWCSLSVGFGYDPKSKDYKVVRFLGVLEGGFDYPAKVEVYTLSTDSWSEINFGAKIYFQGFKYLYLNGACYWMALGDFAESMDFILSFDTSHEVFKNISVPDSSSNNHKASWNLIELKESLALVLLDTNVMVNSFEIWIMEEYGVNRTWKKIFRIEPNLRLQIPLVFWKKDELVLDRDGRLCSYNLVTQEIKHLQVGRHLAPFSAVT